MNPLNNKPETQRVFSQRMETQFASLRRSMHFLMPPGESFLEPRFSRAQTSSTGGMSVETSQPRMNDAQEINADSWKKILNDWVNESESLYIKVTREVAAERMRVCIEKNGKHLNLYGLQLSSLPPILNHCKALKELDCGDNKLTELHIADCKFLESVYCNRNELTQLNLEGCYALQILRCDNNQLNQLSLDGCNALQTLMCENNQLTQLNLSDCKVLEGLCCRDNQLMQLNLEGCNALQTLSCGNNQLTQLNLEGCSVLQMLECSGNQLTQLNLEGCNTLQDLRCENNQLAQLYLESCNALQSLACGYNRLTRLQLDRCERLMELHCSNNNQLRFDHLDFLLNMRNLRDIECSHTNIGWLQLPEGIRNNQYIFIDIRPQQVRHQDLKNAQNTHVQSVHRGASQNAEVLKINNETQNLEQAYLELCEWINQLPTDGATIQEGYANDHFKNLTAKDWIAAPRHLKHKDENSGVSVKEFLALAWCAAKDSAQREPHVPEATAKEALVNALYEIRRGYNLNADHNPKDNGADAHNICAGGTFNKISEKLVSIIQGAVSPMVTGETFSMSLRATIKRIVQDELEAGKKLDLKTDEDGNLFLTPQAWDAIQETVIDSIRAEFKDDPVIAGKTLEQHIDEQTDFGLVLQYFSLS